MDPIQSVSLGNSGALRSAQATSIGKTDASAPAAATQGSSVLAASAAESVTTMAVSQRVETFLGSINPNLSNNAYLKLLIAALIMQVLLGEDGGAQQTGAAGLQGLEALAGGRNTALYLSIESSTNTVQLSQQSARLDVNSAVQSLTESANGTDQPGKQMDVTG